MFNIDLQTGGACGGTVKVIACIEDPAVIDKILTHLQEQVVTGPNERLSPCRLPPAGRFD